MRRRAASIFNEPLPNETPEVMPETESKAEPNVAKALLETGMSIRIATRWYLLGRITNPVSERYGFLYCKMRLFRRADERTRTADLLITSDN